jgi:16S rRNA processing protein RimM
MQKYEIEKVGYAKNQVVLKFKNIDTVEEAEKLRNSYILINRNDLEDLPEGVYYIADLIGLKVYTETGEYLGIVDDIFQTGSNDVYVVKNDLGQSKLLPGIDKVIKEINLPESKIIVNLIEGL